MYVYQKQDVDFKVGRRGGPSDIVAQPLRHAIPSSNYPMQTDGEVMREEGEGEKE